MARAISAWRRDPEPADLGRGRAFLRLRLLRPALRIRRCILVSKGLAYVCDLSPEEIDAVPRLPGPPGKDSPFRNRSIEENLDLFARMKGGEFPDGTRTLRAKIDMASPNIWMRDPVLYRIRHAEHHHTGGKWRIYPMYDFAHCLSDYIEGITHSICTLEFEVHRPLYDWILENLDLPRPLPRQYEFARLSLGYTVMSKRKLMQLVNEGLVTGWDDPRMPTISGLRRRGVTPQALRDFAYNIGITKYNGLTDVAVLEHCHPRGPQPPRPPPPGGAAARQGRHHQLPRRPGRATRRRQQSRRPDRRHAQASPSAGNSGSSRTTSWKARRRSTSASVPAAKSRLKYAYIIKCDEVVKDASGRVVELRCTADLDSKTGGPTADRKVKGTIHWVSAPHAMDAEVRLYDRLFTVAEPDAGGDFKKLPQPAFTGVVTAKCEPSLKDAQPGSPLPVRAPGLFRPR